MKANRPHTVLVSPDIPRHWRLQKERYRLVGSECSSCHEKIFPKKEICPCCGDNVKDTFQFSGKGEVYSSTTVYEAPNGFIDQTPYTVAMVRLEEGPLVTARLTDLRDRDVPVGTPVEMVTRKLKQDPDERGLLVYGYAFRPVIRQG